MKNHRKSKIVIFLKNLDLDLSFGEGFDGIRQLARFLCYFEIYRFLGRFFVNPQKLLPLG